MVNLFNEVEMISRESQTVLLGKGGSTGGSSGGSGEEEDPPWIYPNGTENYAPIKTGG
ncbi:MAG: hypothetical protein WBH03_16715 [Cyclobacteriaceae bacterium]